MSLGFVPDNINEVELLLKSELGLKSLYHVRE